MFAFVVDEGDGAGVGRERRESVFEEDLDRLLGLDLAPELRLTRCRRSARSSARRRSVMSLAITDAPWIFPLLTHDRRDRERDADLSPGLHPLVW